MIKITENLILEKLAEGQATNWDLMKKISGRDNFDVKVYNQIRYRLKNLMKQEKITSKRVQTNDNKFVIMYELVG